MLLLEAEAAVILVAVMGVASGLQNGKSLGIVLQSFRFVFIFIISHTYLCLYSVLLKKKEIVSLL